MKTHRTNIDAFIHCHRCDYVRIAGSPGQDSPRGPGQSGGRGQLAGGLAEEPLPPEPLQQHRQGGLQQHDQDHRMGAHILRE